MNRFVFLRQYNLIEWTNQLDLYVGLQLGITSSQFDYQTTPIIDHRLTELETSNPVAGVEVGSRIYFGHHLKMQLFVTKNRPIIGAIRLIKNRLFLLISFTLV